MGQQTAEGKKACPSKKKSGAKAKRGFLSKLFSSERKYKEKKGRKGRALVELSVLDEVLAKCSDIQTRIRSLEEICARIDSCSASFATSARHSASGDIGGSVVGSAASPSYTSSTKTTRSRSSEVKREVRELLKLIRSRVDLFQSNAVPRESRAMGAAEDSQPYQDDNEQNSDQEENAMNLYGDDEQDGYSDSYRSNNVAPVEDQADDRWSGEIPRPKGGGILVRVSSSDSETSIVRRSSIPSAISDVACSRVSSSFSSPHSSRLKGGKVAADVNSDACSINTSDMTVFQKFRRVRRVCSTCSRTLSCEEVFRFQSK